jgi:hypothetical protein
VDGFIYVMAFIAIVMFAGLRAEGRRWASTLIPVLLLVLCGGIYLSL